MRKFLTLTIFVSILFLSCQRKSTLLSNDELQISIGTICGWCAGGDLFTIGASQSVYKSIRGCNEKTDETTAITDKDEWQKLISLFDKEAFYKINLNVCNVCADGCDVSVTIKEKNKSHSISYGGLNNDAVATIRPFLEKLENIRKRYSDKYQIK